MTMTVNWAHPLLVGATDVLWSGAGTLTPRGALPTSVPVPGYPDMQLMGGGDSSSGYVLSGKPNFVTNSGDMTITVLAIANTQDPGSIAGYDYFDGSYGSFAVRINERRTGGYAQRGSLTINFSPTKSGYAEGVSIGAPYIENVTALPFYNTGVLSCVSAAFTGASATDVSVYADGVLKTDFERASAIPTSDYVSPRQGIGLGGRYNAGFDTFDGNSGTGSVALIIVHDRKLTTAEQISITTDVFQVFNSSANAAPTFPGPNIGDQTGTVGTALTNNTVSDSFSDSDALTFSTVGVWPDGVNLSSSGIISGTPTTAGTYAALQVRATDTAAQTVDSDTFSFTIAAVAVGTLTIPAFKDWSTGNLKSNELGVTVIVNDVTSGELVIKKTGQATHETTGVCVVTDALIIAAKAYRVTTILSDGSEGTWVYTAS